MNQPRTQPRESNLKLGPKSALEIKFIEGYLLSKGYDYDALKHLPEKEARELMKEACLYASLKLAEIEARARLRDSID